MSLKHSYFATLVFLGAVACPAHASVYLDFEVDPLPLVQIQAVLPAGFEAKEKAEAGAANLLAEVMEDGTSKMDRRAFNERLSEFGASFSFNVSNRYSEWHLSFPIVEGKSYDGLRDVLAENWQDPRINEASVKLAKLKLSSIIRSSVDADSGLAMSAIQRWIKKEQYHAIPLFIEDVERQNVEHVRAVFERDFHKAHDIWIGVVGPEAAKPFVKALLAKIFHEQGEVQEGLHLEALKLWGPEAPQKTNKKTFIILDKPDRTQAVTGAMGVFPSKLGEKQELPFNFGQHILFDAGLGSIFAEEVRTKRGLAYYANSAGKFFLGAPMLSFVSNPLRPKADEALKVFADLVKDAFVDGSLIQKLPSEVWKRDWTSFKYGKILSASTPSGRLNERQEVVLGVLSPEFYKSDPDDWRVKPKQVAESLKEIWLASSPVFAIVGDAKELSPMVKAHFPDYNVITMPYRDSISEKAYP